MSQLAPLLVAPFSNLILGSTSQNNENWFRLFTNLQVSRLPKCLNQFSVFWLVLPRINFEMSLPSHSGLYVIDDCRRRGACGIRVTRFEGAKRPSAEWSKSPETPTGWHLTIAGPSDWVVNQFYCSSSRESAFICAAIVL